MKEMWNQRYGQKEFAYGTAPNDFFKTKLEKLRPGKILLPAEGEGRNAVYAAQLGWEVFAFDMSDAGQTKALELAAQNKVNIHYKVGEMSEINFEPEQFDALALIFAHFPPHLQTMYHRQLDAYLKKGGTMILEGFSTRNMKYQVGKENPSGPRDINMLFSTGQMERDFSNYNILELNEEVVELDEGLYHQGKSSVIRFVGSKK
jgi:cyclopropane fatty-acyl-phospholipid synthase-like methyltransferase